VSSRTARAIQRNSVLKKTITKQKQKAKKKKKRKRKKEKKKKKTDFFLKSLVLYLNILNIFK
jgi:hypothetical protein